MADNWKTDGNCNECRRKNYCGHKCTKHEKAVKGMIAKWLKEKGSTEAIKAQLQSIGEIRE